MFHLLAVHGAEVERVSYETDRLRFIGRGNTIVAPQAMSDSSGLSGTHGSVLDPIVAIQCRMTLDPEQSVTIDMASGIGETREAVLSLVEKYQDRSLADRVFDLAWSHGQVIHAQLNATGSRRPALWTTSRAPSSTPTPRPPGEPEPPDKESAGAIRPVGLGISG